LTVQEAGYSGIKNGELIGLANNKKRVLISRDMHFSNILKFPPKNHYGIIVLKITVINVNKVHANLLNILEEYTNKKIERSLFIVDHNKFRIRK